MGNRSRYVMASAAGAAVAVAVARRARLRRATEGFRGAVMPSRVADRPSDRVPGDDEAHAPGHRHLGAPPEVAAPATRGRGPRRLGVRRISAEP